MNDTSQIVPEDGWYFSYDAASGKQYILDSGIKVYSPSDTSSSLSNRELVLICVYGIGGFLFLIFAALMAFKMGLFSRLKEYILEKLRRNLRNLSK